MSKFLDVILCLYNSNPSIHASEPHLISDDPISFEL